MRSLFNSEAEKRENSRACLRSGIKEAVDRGELRPHEAERALDLAVNNWKGSTTAGAATRAAVDAFKKGIVR
jgi:hypothetical protein